MNKKGTVCLIIFLGLFGGVKSSALARTESTCSCQSVTVAMFLSEEEQQLVHSLLYERGSRGPNFDNLLDEDYFYVKAPRLEREENVREIGIGFLHSECENRIAMYEVRLMIARVESVWMGLDDEDDIIILKSSGSLMPRLRLWDPEGLVREVQVLPYFGDDRAGTVNELFGFYDGELYGRGYTVEIMYPIESPVKARLVSFRKMEGRNE